jgi:hypothetical protein
MRICNLDVAGAMNCVGEYHYKKQDEFIALRKKAPSFESEVDTAVEDFLGNWIRGNCTWNFEGRRYFGDKGLSVQQKRWLFGRDSQNKLR